MAIFYLKCNSNMLDEAYSALPENIITYSSDGRSLEILREGGVGQKSRFLKENIKHNWNSRGVYQKSFHEGCMAIFWKNTSHVMTRSHKLFHVL